MDDGISDSIYGTYSKGEPITTWSDIFSGIQLKVEPVNSVFIKISTPQTYLKDMVFDSVRLNADNSFTVNQVVGDIFSNTGYSRATGSGSFGYKKLSLEFTVHRDPSTSGVATSILKIVNATKTGN